MDAIFDFINPNKTLAESPLGVTNATEHSVTTASYIPLIPEQ